MSEFNMSQIEKALVMLEEQQRALTNNRLFLLSTMSELGDIATAPMEPIPQSSNNTKVVLALQKIVINFLEAAETDIVDLDEEDAAATRDMYIGDALDYHAIITLLIESKDGEAINMQNSLDTAPRGCIDTDDNNGFILREFFR